MSSSKTQNENIRPKFRERLNQFRHKFRVPSKNVNIDSNPKIQAAPSTLPANLDSSSKPATFSAFSRTHDVPEVSTATRDDASQIQTDQSTFVTVIHPSGLEENSPLNHSTLSVDIDLVIVSSDLWSAAYREAVDSFGKGINAAIFKGENVAQLFKQLEEVDKEATQESAFLRGVRYLQFLQVPLERFKLALDLATPLTNIEPTATVFGVVRSVTAIAISFSTADLEFAKQIGEMLEQISYIDDCDTLGQKGSKKDIHQALVLVYQKLLEFYNVAFEILTRKGAKLVLKIILENDRLPDIIKDFLKHADNLRKLVQKATWEIVEDIKSMLYDYEISSWLGSGKMSQQSQYHSYLQDLQVGEACEFLLTDANFTSWYCATDSQQLVILGDMGCGKTVAMAFLIDELRRRNKHQLPQPKICYHYCQDDETGQAIYIFSALILSLLEQFSGLKKTFFEWYKQAGASGNFQPATNVRKLEEFLQKTLETLDRPLFIVIDGLDECDRASRNNLLKSLKFLSQKTPRLKIILSSRPQEEILEQLNEMAKIDLGSNAKRDSIIAEKTVERQLSYLSKDVRTLVTERLSCLAQGSSLWTKMVVELIEVRKIRAPDPMRAFLQKIPQPAQLSKLYVGLFLRYTSNDPENQTLAATALKILAITRRPLSILELAWAVALDAAQEGVTTVAALAKLVDHQRVMSLIQPFIARVDFSDVKKRQVRVVHQSVREFIIREWDSNRPVLQGQAQGVSTPTDRVFIHQRSGSLEAGILDICIRYLLLDDIGHTNLFSEEQMAMEELPQEFDLFNNDDEPNDYDPCCSWEAWEENMIRYDPIDRGFGELFVYASCHWLEHFGAVTVEPLPGLGNIEKLCQAGSTRMQNWIKQQCRPECTIKPRFLFDSTLYDPLSITSLYGSEAMLLHMLERSDFDKDKFLPHPALGAADQIFQWGSLSRLKMLFLGSKIGHQLQNLDFFRLLMKQWSFSDNHREDWDVVFDIVDDMLDILVKERWGNELLCVAASTGCMPIIRRLMERAQHNSELKNELLRGPQRGPQTMSYSRAVHQSIGEAILLDHVDVVEYLLEQEGIEAHLQHRNSRGENVLHLASRLCNPAMFQLLVPRFKEGMHQTDDQNRTVLVRVITSSSDSQNRYDSARILLLKGAANENGRSKDEQQEQLRIAARLGDTDMCYLLIRSGTINPATALDGEQIALMDKTFENEQNWRPI
ncbi:hypothetical protein V498_04342 [Pseudogymnoascus sp. VKM F-4517 (FW-2822)]|nr:hypothetical protein V498_04342 [Pseudogymnoascus sp. VKM F-4517 (FW-2822)]